MIFTVPMAFAAAVSMSVGATVIRPEPKPAVAIARGAVTISNADDVIVTAEGGTAMRARDGNILVTPGAAGRVVVTLTY